MISSHANIFLFQSSSLQHLFLGIGRILDRGVLAPGHCKATLLVCLHQYKGHYVQTISANFPVGLAARKKSPVKIPNQRENY